METTFMTIHNLTPEANVMYASDSIVDILGYSPEDVAGRSCFDYFHPDEVPFARGVHDRGVKMDKAAVLHYARIRGADGQWVGCECVFTIVYDVLVACTSIYRGDANHERRAEQAKSVRRLFTSSPQDPRYHMLEHLSSKFRSPPQMGMSEPRAALILNRFTRDLPVMYATDAVASILGVTAEELNGKSFYECMQENCQPDAIRCLESAKANDSIAYLRFVYRDPCSTHEVDDNQAMRQASQSSDSEEGGVELATGMDVDSNLVRESSSSGTSRAMCLSGRESFSDNKEDKSVHSHSPPERRLTSRTSSGEGTDPEHDSTGAIFDQRTQGSRSSTSSVAGAPLRPRPAHAAAPTPHEELFEIEAVVSCTSDGLVVILRKARSIIPELQAPVPAVRPVASGIFAAPWGANPIQPLIYQDNGKQPFHHGFEAPVVPAGGPPPNDFMNSIREIAVFAWSLAGINGNIAEYSHGVPRGDAVPPGGLPVWDPYAQPAPNYLPPINQALERWEQRDLKYGHAMDGGERVCYQNDYEAGEMAQAFPGFHHDPNRGQYFFQGSRSYIDNGYDNMYNHTHYQGFGIAGNANPPNTQPEQGQGQSGASLENANRNLWY